MVKFSEGGVAIKLFLSGVNFKSFFEVVSKRWSPLNEDFFAVLFLGLETRFKIK